MNSVIELPSLKYVSLIKRCDSGVDTMSKIVFQYTGLVHRNVYFYIRIAFLYKKPMKWTDGGFVWAYYYSSSQKLKIVKLNLVHIFMHIDSFVLQKIIFYMRTELP